MRIWIQLSTFLMFTNTFIGGMTWVPSNKAEKCVMEQKKHNPVVPSNTSSENWCKPVYDGYMCWYSTAPLELAVQLCPGAVADFNPTINVSKLCTANGTWEKSSDGEDPWTNYTVCVNATNISDHRMLIFFMMIGHVTSFGSILLALLIKTLSKGLRWQRLGMHVHVLGSIAAHNVIYVIYYYTITAKPNFNYEVFVEEYHGMRWFKWCGWLLPLACTVIFAICRVFFFQDTERCWTDQSSSNDLIVFPVGLTMIIAMCLLGKVVYILMYKRHPSNHTGKRNIKTAITTFFAAIAIIGLFGLQFIIPPVYFDTNSIKSNLYQIYMFMCSLQGLIMSLLFYYCKTEDVATIKARITRYRKTQEAIAMIDRRQAELRSEV